MSSPCWNVSELLIVDNFHIYPHTKSTLPTNYEVFDYQIPYNIHIQQTVDTQILLAHVLLVIVSVLLFGFLFTWCLIWKILKHLGLKIRPWNQQLSWSKTPKHLGRKIRPWNQQLSWSKTPKGIPNLRNTCYMNSILQVLCWTPLLGNQLQKQIMSWNHEKSVDCVPWYKRFTRNVSKEATMVTNLLPFVPERIKQWINEEEEETMTGSLFNLIFEIHGYKFNMNETFTVEKSLPEAILRQARKINSQFNGHDQQDSFEMFNAVISGIEDEQLLRFPYEKDSDISDTNHIMNVCPVSLLMGGEFITVYVYDSCSHIEIQFQRFTSISVPVLERKQTLLREIKYRESEDEFDNIDVDTVQTSTQLNPVPNITDAAQTNFARNDTVISTNNLEHVTVSTDLTYDETAYKFNMLDTSLDESLINSRQPLQPFDWKKEEKQQRHFKPPDNCNVLFGDLDKIGNVQNSSYFSGTREKENPIMKSLSKSIGSKVDNKSCNKTPLIPIKFLEKTKPKNPIGSPHFLPSNVNTNDIDPDGEPSTVEEEYEKSRVGNQIRVTKNSKKISSRKWNELRNVEANPSEIEYENELSDRSQYRDETEIETFRQDEFEKKDFASEFVNVFAEKDGNDENKECFSIVQQTSVLPSADMKELEDDKTISKESQKDRDMNKEEQTRTEVGGRVTESIDDTFVLETEMPHPVSHQKNKDVYQQLQRNRKQSNMNKSATSSSALSTPILHNRNSDHQEHPSGSIYFNNDDEKTSPNICETSTFSYSKDQYQENTFTERKMQSENSSSLLSIGKVSEAEMTENQYIQFHNEVHVSKTDSCCDKQKWIRQTRNYLDYTDESFLSDEQSSTNLSPIKEESMQFLSGGHDEVPENTCTSNNNQTEVGNPIMQDSSLLTSPYNEEVSINSLMCDGVKDQSSEYRNLYESGSDQSHSSLYPGDNSSLNPSTSEEHPDPWHHEPSKTVDQTTSSNESDSDQSHNSLYPGDNSNLNPPFNKEHPDSWYHETSKTVDQMKTQDNGSKETLDDRIHDEKIQVSDQNIIPENVDFSLHVHPKNPANDFSSERHISALRTDENWESTSQVEQSSLKNCDQNVIHDQANQQNDSNDNHIQSHLDSNLKHDSVDGKITRNDHQSSIEETNVDVWLCPNKSSSCDSIDMKAESDTFALPLKPLKESANFKTDVEEGLLEQTNIENFKEEELGCRICEKNALPGGHKAVHKRLMVHTAPGVLVLQINRFRQTFDGKLEKIQGQVTYPKVLDLSPFCSSAMRVSGDVDEVLYSLYGVVAHTGTVENGHYFAFVRTNILKSSDLHHHKFVKQRNDPEHLKDEILKFWKGEKVEVSHDNGDSNESDTWFYISDTNVTLTTEQNVLDEANAYILMYERIK